MFSQLPTPEQIRSDWGDRVLAGIAGSVESARDDFREFRDLKPEWMVDMSSRTTAGFIHDRIVSELRHRLDGIDGVSIVGYEPLCEIVIGNTYSVRVKRHGPGDVVSSYPTLTALEFWGNEPPMPGFEHWNLAAGYRWDPDSREMGDAVLSFRLGMRKVLWAISIAASSGSVAGFSWNPIEPQLPDLDLSRIDRPVEERESWA